MPATKPKARLFVEADLAPGANLRPVAAQAHYLGQVMRLRVGDFVAVFNGRDGEWLARIRETGRKTCALSITEQTRHQEPEPDLWLAFAPLKKTRVDFVVEKATELGVSRLWTVFTRHTAVARINLDRLRARAIEAAEQCERLTVPEVSEPLPLEELIAAWPTRRPLLVLDETGGGKPIAEVLHDIRTEAARPPFEHGILIGPEGGFARSELDGLVKLPFVTMVGLGPRILRAETAALSALACWQALVGDWGGPSLPQTGHQ